jgi:hypothetical protein
VAAGRTVVVSGRHRPHEVLLLVVSLLVGLAYTVGAPQPDSVTVLLPCWALLVWTGGLVVSGLLGLTGIVLRRPYALQLEQAGMLIGSGAMIWYSAAVAMLGWRALLASAVCLAWAGANAWRAAQIRRDLRGAA